MDRLGGPPAAGTDALGGAGRAPNPPQQPGKTWKSGCYSGRGWVGWGLLLFLSLPDFQGPPVGWIVLTGASASLFGGIAHGV